MPKTTRADEIIKKAKRTDREKFETLKKKKHGTPKKVTSKPSTKRARIGSVKRTVCYYLKCKIHIKLQLPFFFIFLLCLVVSSRA